MFPSQTLRRLVLLSTLILPSLGAIYTDPAQLKASYDYVIVGAGTAGNVVANRLSEDPSICVLILEAGGSNAAIDSNTLPPQQALYLTPDTPYDWNSTTLPMPGMNNRTIPYPRGKVLGGSSSVHHWIYTHGSQDDYDDYAKIAESDDWSWDNMQYYIEKTEKIVRPKEDLTGVSPASEKGTDSILPVSYPGYPNPIDLRVVATTKELGDEFPFNKNSSSGNPIGMGWSQSTIENGKRIDSASSYLAPQYISRPNLDVLIGAQATELLTTKVKRNTPSFHDVRYVTASGATKIAHAKREVVLAAGAVGTPQLLMLSGIGDSEALSKVGITATINLPSVGRNMSDHVLLGMPYQVNSNETEDEMFRDASLMGQYKAQWDKDGSGPLSAALANQLGWLRLAEDSDALKKYGDPTTGPNSAHYELIFVNLFFGPVPKTGNYMTVIANLISPTSRGTIELKSSDPADQPLINLNLLGTDFDVAAMVEAVKASQKFLTASAWKDFVIGAFGDFANVKTDADIEQYVRNSGNTVIHMVGTASMSPAGAQWGVVDPDLKVKGAEGLRIVDASVIPHVGSAHTQGPVYIFAERAADLIKKDIK